MKSHDSLLTSEVRDEVVGLLREGKKIEAIKVYRKHVSVGLKESKEAVEAIGNDLGIVTTGSGCLSSIILTFSCALFISLLMLPL